MLGCSGLIYKELGSWKTSRDRATNPKYRAISMFHGSSYGGQVNLEGDIGGYLLARNIQDVTDVSSLQIKENTYLSDLLSAYLPINPKKISDDWKFRCYYFLQMLGAEYNNKYALKNRTELVLNIKDKVLAFGEWYIVVRLGSNLNKDTLEKIIDTSAFLEGAAMEVSRLFVDTLIVGALNPGSPISTKGEGPNPTPKGEPYEKYLKLKETKDWFSEIKKMIENR